MSYTTARAAIATRLGTVTDIGVVLNRERYVSNHSDYLKLFSITISGTRQIRGWFITRPIIERRDFAQIGINDVAETYVVHGIHGFKDSTDTDAVFGALIDSVMAALVGLRVTGYWNVEPPNQRVSDLRHFGSELCHYCEIAITLHREA